jgi:hypothetical protein
MSISSIGSSPVPNNRISPTAKHTKPAATNENTSTPKVPTSDPDHDGDTDGPGLDVAG